jgi:pimeloyl-ACP methyl ester carboxylesterase
MHVPFGSCSSRRIRGRRGDQRPPVVSVRVGSPAVLGCVLVITSVACTLDDHVQRHEASFEVVPCPPEVSVVSVTPISCGYVTVPEDRSEPGGRSVRIFVFRIPPHGAATGPPVLYVGGEIGFSFDYTNVNDVAETLPGHELIAIELRGTGHSEPNLSCPEVEAVSGRARTEPIDDAGMRATFLEAVASCRARISAQGIDPGDFDIPALGADILDVVGALGLGNWEILSKGSTSRAVFEAMRSNPSGLQGVVLYNPEFPDTDPFVQAFESTRASLAHLADMCNADPRCRRRFPSVQTDAQLAIDRLQASPVQVRSGGAAVLMDGAALLRSLRERTSSMSTELPNELPATITAIAHDADITRTLTHLAAQDAASQTYCSGYLPTCPLNLNQGAYYSVLCRDEEPFVDVGSLTRLAAGDRSWSADYVESPYLDVCNAWDVQPGSGEVTQPIISDVPVFIESGAFSPFMSPGAIRGGITGLTDVSVGVSTVHNDGGFFDRPHCPDKRLSFLNDPQAPIDSTCYGKGHIHFRTAPI